MSILGSILIMLLTLCFVCFSLVLERAMEKEEEDDENEMIIWDCWSMKTDTDGF